MRDLDVPRPKDGEAHPTEWGWCWSTALDDWVECDGDDGDLADFVLDAVPELISLTRKAAAAIAALAVALGSLAGVIVRHVGDDESWWVADLLTGETVEGPTYLNGEPVPLLDDGRPIVDCNIQGEPFGALHPACQEG